MDTREPTQEEYDRVLGELARTILSAFSLSHDGENLARMRSLIDSPPNLEIEEMIRSFIKGTQEEYLGKKRGLVVCLNSDCDGSCWFEKNECGLGTNCPFCSTKCVIIQIERKHILPWFVGPANLVQSSHAIQSLMIRDLAQSLGEQFGIRVATVEGGQEMPPHEEDGGDDDGDDDDYDIDQERQ